MTNIDIFHVHTYRCGHAGIYLDEEYVKKAVAIGATSITFTDHAPFPNNPFGSRMKMGELEEYIFSLQFLRHKYKQNIDVNIGLEIEYFPKYADYYKELSCNPNIDILILGQHMYDISDDAYSFSLSKETLSNEEYLGLGNNIIEGIKTGFFSVVAHPDRIFRRHKDFKEREQQISQKIIDTAIRYNVALEINKSSIDTGLYIPAFWQLASQSSAKLVYGLDAHSPEEICIWDNS